MHRADHSQALNGMLAVVHQSLKNHYVTSGEGHGRNQRWLNFASNQSFILQLDISP